MLLHIMTGQDFDIVGLFLCEIEDVIMEGMHRKQPFAHWISWILARLAQGSCMSQLEQSRTRFKVYSPTNPRDNQRGPRGQRRAQQILDERALAEFRVVDDTIAAEDASLAAVEAQLPHYLAIDSEDSEDDDYYIPTIPVHRAANDDEAGSSSAAARAPPPPITGAQVTQPDRLADILEKLTHQQMSYAKE